MIGDYEEMKQVSKEYGLSDQILIELRRAQELHPIPVHNAHEGYAVLLEEVDELWDEIKKKNPDMSAIRKEAVQVAAMAMRFILEVVDFPYAKR